ncbi:hypothetical protein GGP41_006816 [Bipolaris sorokiniana]|uniref:Uncharacterized protein n=1 Tax=Cochliobolus sativus TaxID=45130 RepID=A0A8H6E0Z8_COCSA|nr:hypothetical protein GGP41_006816 [Bipolaris sorokiniana]
MQMGAKDVEIAITTVIFTCVCVCVCVWSEVGTPHLAYRLQRKPTFTLPFIPPSPSNNPIDPNQLQYSNPQFKLSILSIPIPRTNISTPQPPFHHMFYNSHKSKKNPRVRESKNNAFATREPPIPDPTFLPAHPSTQTSRPFPTHNGFEKAQFFSSLAFLLSGCADGSETACAPQHISKLR